LWSGVAQLFSLGGITRMVKAIAIYISVVSITAFLWVVIPSSFNIFSGAPVPQPQTGQTVPIIIGKRQVTFYITPQQDRIISVGNAVAIGVLGVSLIGLFLLPVKRKTSHAA
jgi:hypothetical protein